MTRVDEAQITLTIPADPAYVRLVRLVVASSASDLGYAYEEVEDLRIVADEAANLAIGACRPGSAVRVGIFSVDDALAVGIECPTDNDHAEFDPLASQIVAALTTSCAVSSVDGELRVFFRCPPAST
jgi:serine/threonine-protein kinase RsbW